MALFQAQAGEGARTGDASTSTQGDAAQPSPEVSASGRAPANGVNDDLDSPAVLVSHLDFSYPGLDGRPIPGLPPVVRDMSMRWGHAVAVLIWLACAGSGPFLT